MNNFAAQKVDEKIDRVVPKVNFVWSENPAVQKLLDVVVSILVEEYIQVVRKNTDMFEIASAPMAPRNDERG